MGVVVHHHLSLYSFVMGVLWFSAFILLGLIMRKWKRPIKFSATPLLLMLVLSIFRMLIAIEIPNSVVILSETIYPALVELVRLEILPFRLLGFPINLTNLFVCVWIVGGAYFVIRHIDIYISRRPFVNWIGHSVRDEYAESLLAEEIGYDKHFRVFRNNHFNSPAATAFKPYIILPDIDFAPSELRVVLRHEWKHIEDKDHLVGIIIDVICFVFWWNPLVYILRKNFHFAQELKCDRFAVSNKEDLIHYAKGIQLVRNFQRQKMGIGVRGYEANAFISGNHDSADRLKVLALRGESRKKRILTNVCYSFVIVALFFASYMFTILPATWAPPDVPITEDFMGEYSVGIFRTAEIFLVDNGNGIFSLYINGAFVEYLDDTHDFLNWVPIRVRGTS